MILRHFLYIFILISFSLFPIGCGQNENGKNKSEEKEESPSGASFKLGKGVMVTPETSKILGLEIVEVAEEKLPQFIELNAQIFSDMHRFEDINIDHTECDIHASGVISADKAVLVKPEQKVRLSNSENETFDGFVAAVQKPLSHGETEIIIGVTTADEKLKDGAFVEASISIPRNEAVIMIPNSALLRTVEGTFVYAVNGNAYFRTAVKVGSTSGDKIEITDGLYSGDQVVTNPVVTLWLIELRATKGGGHCH